MKNKYFIIAQNGIENKFNRAIIQHKYYAEDVRPDLTYEICSNYDSKAVYKSIKSLINRASKEGLTKAQRNLLFERLIKRHKRLVHLYIDYLRECKYDEIRPFKGKIEYCFFDESELGAYAGYYPIDATEDDTETINRIELRYKERIEEVKQFLIFEIPNLKEDYAERELLTDTSLRFKHVYNELKGSSELSFILKTPNLFARIINDPKFLENEVLPGF